MSLALASTSIAGDPAIAAKTHHVAWHPAAAVQAEQSHRVLVGEGTVDLTRVPLAPGRRLRVTAQVTLGVLAVRVPDTARIELDARALLGDITVDRHVTSGPGARVRRTLEPESRNGGAPPVIELRMRSKIGDMEVTRVPA
jgi:predicted membrane protein